MVCSKIDPLQVSMYIMGFGLVVLRLKLCDDHMGTQEDWSTANQWWQRFVCMGSQEREIRGLGIHQRKGNSEFLV